MKRGKLIFITILTFLINISFDRITKILAVMFLKGSNPTSFLNGLVVLRYTENPGSFLSLGAGWPEGIKFIFLLGIPLAVCVFGLVYCLVKEEDMLRVVLIVTIVAGGAGNLLDRMVNHFLVTDFLNFGIGGFRTGILNVADLSVTFGVIMLCLYELKKEKN